MARVFSARRQLTGTAPAQGQGPNVADAGCSSGQSLRVPGTQRITRCSYTEHGYLAAYAISASSGNTSYQPAPQFGEMQRNMCNRVQSSIFACQLELEVV